MIALVPKWAHHYNEFWKAIRSRNLWFIKLRYIFVAALAAFLTAGNYVFHLSLTSLQVNSIIIITLFILFYNIAIHFTRRYVGTTPGKFNCLHLSLVQMILDLFSLLVLIYYTGVIESPLYILAVFQMIIGSLILPWTVVFSISIIYLAIHSAMIILQHHGIIDSHFIAGIYNRVTTPNLNYVVLYISVHWFLVLMSVYIANRIAFKLYKREQQLRESLILNKEIEEKKQKYIVGVVHEIKSPIAAMQSMVNLLLEEYLGPVSSEVKEKLKRLHARSNEALSLVNNVLYLSRLKLLNLSSTEKIQLNQMLDDIAERKREDQKAKNINLIICDERKEKKEIRGDKLLLEIAFSNVISNAFKFTPEGGKVEIKITDTNKFLTLEVSDSGIGIPKEEIKNIFHEFYRAANVKRSNIEGSGLGLALVKEVIDRHYGSVKLISPSIIGDDKHPGTTVLIKLPYISPIDRIEKEKDELIDY